MRRVLPAFSRHPCQCLCRLAVDGCHHVVHRRVGLPIEFASVVARGMFGGVPAPGGEVHAAGERERIIDHHDLLMMRCPDEMGVVVAHVHAAPRFPCRSVKRTRFPLGAEQHRVIPIEDVYLQPASSLHEEVQEIPEQHRQRRLARLPTEASTAVEVPAQNDDGANGALCRRSKGTVILVAVDEQRRASRAACDHAVPARFEQSSRRGGSNYCGRAAPITHARNGCIDRSRLCKAPQAPTMASRRNRRPRGEWRPDVMQDLRHVRLHAAYNAQAAHERAFLIECGSSLQPHLFARRFPQ